MIPGRHARWFEDFTVGEHIEHRRGHTVCTADNQMLSLLTMNTAQTHYNADSLREYMDGLYPAPLLNACVALALAVGLTTDDISGHALRDDGYDGFRMTAAVHVGDTVYASSEIVALSDADRPDAGLVTQRVTGLTVDHGGARTPVLTVDRRIVLKRRTAWQESEHRFISRAHRDALALLAGQRLGEPSP